MKKTISETPVEWDERKSLANIQKHGISFETAALVFADDDRIEYYDKQHSLEEDRYVVIDASTTYYCCIYHEKRKCTAYIRANGDTDRKEHILWKMKK